MERCKIKAAVRLRPVNDRERHGEPRPVWNVDKHTLTSSIGTFSYDHVFDGTANNMNVYEEVGRPIIDAFLQGFNATLFAYGQTASGKTHTIMGANDEPGMIPLALSDIFLYMETQSAHREFILRCAYLEIYNEVLTDLLDDHPGSGKKVKIKEDTQGRVHVQGMSEHRILDGHEAFQLLLRGEEARKFAATAMNDRSSRSHTIYRLTLESKEIGGDMVKVSVLHLVDLAGSEKAHHSADQQRFKEGVKINLSLLHLGIVMAKLSNGEAHIPFRESKLTRILESSIGGNAKTTIVCTVSPFLTDETMSTLKFASRAMQIQNEAQVNEVPTSHEALLKKLKKVEEENRLLRMQIFDADHLEKEKVKLEATDNPLLREKEKEKVLRRQTVCPSGFGQLDSHLFFSRFANVAFTPRTHSQNQHSVDRRMSFFPVVTAHSYSMTSTGDEEEFSFRNVCEVVDGVSPGSFQLVDQSAQTLDDCMVLEVIHCGVQTEEMQVQSMPIQQDSPKQDSASQTEDIMDTLRKDAEDIFRYQLKEYENMTQLREFENLEATVQLEVARKEVENLSVQNLELQKRLDISVSQTKQLKTENDELKVEMDKKAVEVQHLKEKIEQQKTENDELKDVILTKDVELQLQKEKCDEANRLSKMQMEKYESEPLESKMLARMKQQLEEATAAKEREDVLRREAEEGYLEMREKFEKASAAVEQEVSLRKVAEKRHLELMEKMSLLKVEMEEVIKFRDDTELERNQLLEQMSLLETEKKKVIKLRDDAERERKQLIEQVSLLEAEKEEVIKLKDDTWQEIEQLLEQGKELKAENDELKDGIVKRDVEVQHLKVKCDEATKLSKMLMEKCENALVDSEMFAHMREQLEEVNAAMEGQVVLRRKAEENYSEMMKKMSSLEAEKVEAILFRNTTQQEMEQMLQQLQEVEADNERLNEEKQKMEESIASSTEAYQWSLSKVEQQLQEVKADNERLNEEKQKMEESIASSTEAYQWSLSKVEQQLQEVKADNERLNEEKQKMEESIASSTEAYQWSLSKVEQQCDVLSSSHAALEQDLKSSKEECDSLKNHLKKVVEMKRKMEWQRDDAGRQLDDLEEKLEEMKEENDRLHQKCQTVKEQYDGLSSGHVTLEQEFKSSKDECESLKKELKRIVEIKRKMEWQRDDAGRQLDELEEQMEEWALEKKRLTEANAQALEKIKEVLSEKDSIKTDLRKAEDRIAVLEGMYQEKENLPKSDPGRSISLQHTDIEELRKTVVEMQQQRDEGARKVDRLCKQIEFDGVKIKQLTSENQKLKQQTSTRQPGDYAQDPIGHGCGLSLEYETYQLRSQLGECKRREEKLNALCKQMQTEHRTTLIKKDREVQRLQRELECAQQQCETLKREAMPVRHAREYQTASGPQRRVLLEQNSTAEKPAAAVVKPTAMTSTIMPQMNRRGAGPSRREQPAFEWDQTVHESQVESGDCKQQ